MDVSRRADKHPDRFPEETACADSIPDCWHQLQEFAWTMETTGGIFLQEHLKQQDNGLRHTFELFNR